MKLSELIEKMPVVEIGSSEYELKFTTRSKLQLMEDYPENEKMNSVVQSLMTGVNVRDLVNMLYAGLLSSKAFKSKETLIDAIDEATAEQMALYADAVFGAWMKSSITKEQLDKLEVINAQSESKKKNVTTL